MNKIQIWSVESNEGGKLLAKPVEALDNAETETKLEDILVRSPDFLADGLTLIGRQLPTGGGPLDLLGVDEDGQVVVFELERGTLTREAIAQVIDYASDLAETDVDRLSELIEDHSGRDGIEKIEDFQDWYNENYPSRANLFSEKPRMILVGLGADERAVRMVNYLADSGVEIQLLTFHAFQEDGKLFMARQIESIPPSTPTRVERDTAYTKQANLESLRASAKSLQVEELLEEVAGFFSAKLPAYQWPGKTCYSFSLTERTEQGTPSLRVYVRVSLNTQRPGSLNVIFLRRALDATGPAMLSFREEFPGALKYHERYQELEVHITPENWLSISARLGSVLDEIIAGWKAKENRPLETIAEENMTGQGESSGA